MTRDEKRYNRPMPSASTVGRRNPRFRRVDARLPFQLTERDVQIVREVAQRRFLRSSHILQLIGGSDQALLRRLTGLWQAGYLDRPRAQLEYFAKDGGSTPIVYALADRGARLLNRMDALNLTESDWQQKNRDVGHPFILHTLAVADLHVALTMAVRQRPQVALVGQDALVDQFPIRPDDHSQAFSWTTQVARNGWSHSLRVTPDYAFALATPALAQRAYVVECDRGTMPIERADFRQTSIVRKYATYIQGLAEKKHTVQFGWKAMRILFLAHTVKRAENMRQALARYTQAPTMRRQFYFATYGDLVTVLDDVWIDGNGDHQRLI